MSPTIGRSPAGITSSAVPSWSAAFGIGGPRAFAIYLVMTLVSHNSLPDMVASLGLLVTFYYAITAYACVWTYRSTLLKSAHNFWLRGALPLAGAVAARRVQRRHIIDGGEIARRHEMIATDIGSQMWPNFCPWLRGEVVKMTYGKGRSGKRRRN